MFCSLGFKVQTLRHIVWKTFLLSLAYIYKTKKPRVGVSYKSVWKTLWRSETLAPIISILYQSF